jgi:adenylosuccinate lyase
MSSIWEPHNRYRKWLDVEIAACEAWAKLGRIPRKSLVLIRKRAKFSIPRINRIEKTVKHDVIAFLTSVAEYVGPDSRYIHMGLTSSDILDTSLAILMRESADIIMKDITDLLAVLKKNAMKYKTTLRMGRSHGIHAEPTTFGLMFALWYEEMKRNLARLKAARETISYGKLSGPVGTFSNVPTSVEKYVCRKLGLRPAPVSTQIIQERQTCRIHEHPRAYSGFH